MRQAGDVELAAGARQGGVDAVLQHLADHVQAALEGLVVIDPGSATDVELADMGLHGARAAPEAAGVGRHVAPAEQLLAELGDHLGGEIHHLPAHGRVDRQEAHAHPVGARFRQRAARLAGEQLQRGMRDLQQDAGAVAGVRLRTARAAMIQVRQHVKRVVEQRARFAALDVDNEADAA